MHLKNYPYQNNANRVFMITYQIAQPSDLEAIATLHAQSWQQNNRGILDDYFLDHLIHASRLKVWTEIFANPVDNQHIITAKDNGKLCGFTRLFNKKESKYGIYLDSLHVSKNWKGKGIGRHLMSLAGKWVATKYPNQGMNLLVLAENTPAIDFYERVGGKRVETVLLDLGDETGRLGDTYRYYWEHPGGIGSLG